MKLKATVKKDDAGRLTQLQVRKGRQQKSVILDFEYGQDGFVRDIFFEGRKDQLPNIGEIIDLVHGGFIERIGTVKLVNTIETIENIESVDLIDLITTISEITNIKNIEKIEKVTLEDRAAGTRFYVAKALGDAEWWDDAVSLVKAGTLLYLNFYIPAGVGNEGSTLKVECDDKLVFYWDVDVLNSYGFSATSEGIQLLQYNVDGVCVVNVALPFRWRSTFKVTLHSVKAGVFKIEGAANIIE